MNTSNLKVGDIIGTFTILEMVKSQLRYMCVVKCECGRIKKVRETRLSNNKVNCFHGLLKRKKFISIFKPESWENTSRGNLYILKYLRSEYKEGYKRILYIYSCRCACGLIVERNHKQCYNMPSTDCGCGYASVKGTKYNKLTPLEVVSSKKDGNKRVIKWKCLCDCGNTCVVNSTNLKYGGVKSCGCLTNSRIDLTEKVFGRLKVIEKSNLNSSDGTPLWRCVCECGKEGLYRQRNLIQNGSRSCGCLVTEARKKHKRSIKDSGLAAYYKTYKFNAKKRNLSFDITYEEFCSLCFKHCEYCGCRPSNTLKLNGSRNVQDTLYLIENPVYINGIDRINSSVGYTIDNSVPCCTMCNRMKLDHSIEEFKIHITEIYMHMSNTKEN